MIFSRCVFFGLFLFLFMKEPAYSQCFGRTTGSTSLVDICSGNLPFYWNNHYYKEPGCYLARLTNAVGCDSIANLCLQVHSVSSSENIHTCQQDFPFLWHGKTLPAPGIYMDSAVNYQGCDSVIVLNLTASNQWTGAAGNNWEDANNWACHSLPGAATDVVIDSGTVALNSNQTVRNLTVAPRASFTVAPGFNLHITSAPLPSAPVYLTKYIGYSSNGGSYRFTEKNFYYDSLNRLQTVIGNAFQFPAGIGAPGEFDAAFPDTLSYSYLAGDSLPYKVVHNSTSNSYHWAKHYYYDTQSRISKTVNASDTTYSIKYSYSDSTHEIFISDPYDTLHHLLYDGKNVLHDDLGSGSADGVTMEYTDLTNPFSLVPINRHIPYTPYWINPESPEEIHFNKNAIFQTTTYYHRSYQYEGIINGIPASAKLNEIIDGHSTNTLQYFYYKH
jgi:hypothetical protein